MIQPPEQKTQTLCLFVIHPSVPMGLFVMSPLDGLGNAQLLVELKKLVKRDRVLEAELIAHLGEVEARRLHLELGCSSMFDYCVKELRFSESVAYKRIGVARVARRFPSVTVAIARGELHLSAASLIAPHLSEETVAGWLEAACHKKSREVRQLIADRFPREAVRSSVRRVASVSRSAGLEGMALTRGTVQESSVPRWAGSGSLRQSDPAEAFGSSELPELSESSMPPAPRISVYSALRRRAVTISSTPNETNSNANVSGSTNTDTNARASTEALGAQRFSVRFTADEKVHDQLQELRSLLRHSVPDGDVGKILARAIGVLLKQVRNGKIGECASPRFRHTPRSSKENSPKKKKPTRHIPVAIRREVWARDKGRCTFESKDGRSCESREAVEFHHRVAWARRSEHSVNNIALRCRAHNQYEAELDFGREHMVRFRRGTIKENFRREIDPRADTESRAITDPSHQLGSNPVQMFMGRQNERGSSSRDDEADH
jgi:hypothetical protein